MATKEQTMPRTRDEESGKYVENYPRERFTEAIQEHGGMASTSEVAEYVGCSYDLAYKRLRSFENSGEVESRKVANARLWSVAEESE